MEQEKHCGIVLRGCSVDKPEEHLFIIRPGDDRVFSNMKIFVKAWFGKFPLEVIVRAYIRNRTDLQNRFLHGWIFRKQIMKELNDSGQQIMLPDGEMAEYDVDILKEIFKQDCIIEKIVEIKRFYGPDGTLQKVDVKPSQFNTADFAKYCDLVMYYAQEWYGVYVEPPTSGHWLAIYEEMRR